MRRCRWETDNESHGYQSISTAGGQSPRGQRAGLANRPGCNLAAFAGVDLREAGGGPWNFAGNAHRSGCLRKSAESLKRRKAQNRMIEWRKVAGQMRADLDRAALNENPRLVLAVLIKATLMKGAHSRDPAGSGSVVRVAGHRQAAHEGRLEAGRGCRHCEVSEVGFGLGMCVEPGRKPVGL